MQGKIPVIFYVLVDFNGLGIPFNPTGHCIHDYIFNSVINNLKQLLNNKTYDQ